MVGGEGRSRQKEGTKSNKEKSTSIEPHHNGKHAQVNVQMDESLLVVVKVHS